MGRTKMGEQDKTLSLGTIFTANEAQFLAATKRMRTALGGVNTAMGNVAKDTTKSGKKAAEGLHPLNKQISKVHGGLNRLRAAAKVTAAYGLAATAIFGLTNALRSGAEEIVNFDQALRNIEAITGATSAEIALMDDIMRHVAETTKFSTTEIAEGMVLLGQAGFSAGESISAIQAAADLAAGTLTDLATTTDLLTSTVRAFGLQAIEASRVADVMANAINKSKLTVDKIRTSFNYVGAAAAQVGLTLEQTAASMALLANNGLRASTIGTGFRQVLSRMIAPNRKLAETFEEHGIELDSINPKVQGYEKAMLNLTKVITKADGVTVDMTKAFRLFGLRGAQAVAVLTSGFQGEYSPFSVMLRKMFEVGAAEKMAAIQARGLAFKFKNLQDRAKTLALAIGDAGVAGALRSLVDALSAAVTGMERFVKSSGGQVATQMTLLTTLLLGVGSALTILYKALAFIVIGINKWVLALHPTTRLLMVIGAAISAIATTFNFYNKALERNIKANEKRQQQLIMEKGSLMAYKGALESIIETVDKTDEVSVEHSAILQRLAHDHEDLAGVVRESADDYSKFGDVVSVVTEKMLRGEEEFIYKASERISQYTEQIRKQVNVIRSAQELSGERKPEEESFFKRIKHWYEVLLGPFWGLPKDLEEEQEKLNELLADEIEQMDKLYHALLRQGLLLKKDVVPTMRFRVKELERLGFLENLEATVLLDKLIPALEKEIEARKKGKKEREVEKEAKELKESVRLNIRFLSLMRSMEQDRVKEIELSYKRRTEQIKQFYEDEVKFYKKSLEIEDEGEKIQEAKRLASIRKKEADAQNERKRQYDLAKLHRDIALEGLKLEELVAKKKLELQSQAVAVDDQATQQDIKNARRELEIKTNQEILDLDKTFLESTLEQFKEDSKEVYAARLRVARTEVNLQKSKTKDIEGDREDERKNLSEHYELELAEVEKYSAEWLKIREEMYAEDLITMGKLEEDRKSRLKKRAEEEERAYKSGEISAEQYYAVLKELDEQHVGEHEENVRKMIAIDGTWLENLRAGARKWTSEAKTWGETWQEIGEDVADVISTNITSAWFDFIEGSKNAKEAMADFARSTLRWLGEIIVKQMILNALQGSRIGKWLGLGGKAATTPSTLSTPAPIPAFREIKHGGGIVGKGVISRMQMPKRLHNGGIADKEVPIIAEKGEGVFTEEQMKAMGLMVKEGQKVSIVNSFDGALFMDRRQLMEVVTDVASQIAMTVTQQTAANAVVEAVSNDHPIRRVMQQGGY